MEGEKLELKKIHAEVIPRAIERADHYRLLNDPEPAESICLDILAVDPKNQRAIVTLVLALTDQFKGGDQRSAMRTMEYVAKLDDPYQRAYYRGIVHEKQARAWLERGMSAVFAYDGFRDAMDAYEEAEKIRPDGNDDALLRYNSCVRTIERHRLVPRHDPHELPLE